MRKVLTVGVALVAAVAITGCTSAGAATPGLMKETAATAKPPLKIPSSFVSPQARLEYAMKANAEGYHKEIAATLEKAVEEVPTAEGFMALGSNRYSLFDYIGAIAAWKKAAELSPAVEGEAWNNIGNALRDSHRYPEAEGAYREALAIEPARWTAAINLASMAEQQGKLTEAVAVLEAASKVNQDVQPLKGLLAAYQQKLHSTAEE